MVKKKGTHKKRTYSLLIYTAIAMSFIMSCVTTQTGDMAATEEKIPVIKKAVVNQYPLTTTVELISSEPSPYTSFKLTDPSRLVLDLRGEPGPDLPLMKKINDSNINDISFKKGVTQSYTTRMTVNIKDKIEYTITSEENIIKLSFFSKLESTAPLKSMKETTKPVESTMVSEKPGVMPSEPRIMFQPIASDMNKILGIDFTMLEHGKSRLTVSTDKKSRYDMDRKGEKSLLLTVYDVTIPSILLRRIDTTQFESALDQVTPSFSEDKKEVNIEISLREMVPFHVKQTTEGISMDFGQTTIQPPEKKIKTIDMTAIQAKNLAAVQQPVKPATMISAEERIMPKQVTTVAEQPEGVYSGERMYLDFNNEDVTNILRLINVVSKENIIWDPAISGRKVSMILKDVPWDQALELILKNNDLAKSYVGENIIWITTKAKMRQFLAEQEAEKQRIQRQLQEEIQKKEEKEEKAKADAPLITEYLPVDFATATEIQDHITLTDRGIMSVDTRTNTIIIRDTAESIEEAKKTIKQFDTPVKQIVIEARIVDATENFSRDLGLQWNSNTQAWRSNRDYLTLVPPYALNEDGSSLTNGGGETVYGGSFSTNSPDSWASNIGLSFAKITSSGLGALTLDAAIALAESEGSAKTLSAPKVIAREGTSATISSGDSIIIPATENVASTTLDATLSLTVTPSAVSFNDYITLDVNVTDDQAPSTSRLIRKSISTTLMIKSGDTVVIGGIIKESEGEDITGFPVLKDVPGLGWLFKAKRKTNQKSELLIFLTPTVLPTPVKSF